ncbi:DUF92 domain-containing protein [Paenibacillus gansuensis]|uniref:DUF92 domain-containing protein n=1 Tax=Paenibacillus gansuensis TaxID=306542 RepID=A0ABW5PED8_9BACL
MLWLYGIAGSFFIAGAAYRFKSLSLSGFAAAVVMGTLMFGLGNAAWYGTLIAFFVSSSLLSKFKKQRKAASEERYEKTDRRDAGQVLANGGLGLALCIANAVAPHDYWFAMFVGAMAAVTADTWATEVGGLGRGEPRSIRTGRRVPKGTSGAVSLPGTAASFAGGLFIGAAAAVLGGGELLPLAALGGLAGLAGSLADSLLGATVQAMYACRVCGEELERARHCGQPTALVRGSARMNNDAVNFVCSASGALAALLLAAIF